MLPFRPFEITVISLMIISIVALFAWVADYNSKYYSRVSQDKTKCEAAGGVYLDRTYHVGKSGDAHLYTCVDKNIIIKEY